MLDLNLDMNSFEPEKIDINQNTNVISGLQNTNIDEEEQKRILEREKEAELRKKRINKKIQEEEEKRNEIRIKAAEFMAEFNQKRQEEIEKRKKLLEENNYYCMTIGMNFHSLPILKFQRTVTKLK